MRCCEDCLTATYAFNAIMPLSRASTRGSYSRIEGLTLLLPHRRRRDAYGAAALGRERA